MPNDCFDNAFQKSKILFDSIIPFNRFLILKKPKENQKINQKKHGSTCFLWQEKLKYNKKFNLKNAIKIFRRKK